MTRTAQRFDPSDPYGFGPHVEAPIIHRTIPAKGARVGIVQRSGFCHKQFGISPIPAVVDSFDASWLYLLSPDESRRFALSLRDDFTLLPADECTFFLPCRKCDQLGEHRMGKGDPCKTCNGDRVVNNRVCADCKGRGRSAGDNYIVSCVECGGWGIHFEKPWKLARRKPVRKQKPTPTGDDVAASKDP
jgi:hypothetical protein